MFHVAASWPQNFTQHSTVFSIPSFHFIIHLENVQKNFWNFRFRIKNVILSKFINNKKSETQISRRTENKPRKKIPKVFFIKLRMQIVYTNFQVFFPLSLAIIINADGPLPSNTSPKPFHLINLICYNPRKAHFMNNYCTLKWKCSALFSCFHFPSSSP